MPMIIKTFKKVLPLVVAFSIFLSINSFAAVVYFKQFYKTDKPNSDTITVIGDSYAGWFAGYESFKDYNIAVYANAGKTTEVNFEMMEDGFKSSSDIYIISIGVNDHANNIDINEFKDRIEILIKTCSRNGKRVLLHTYMNYQHEYPENFYKHKEQDYDKVLKDLASKYLNAYYVDMSDYNNEIFLQDDKIHYNRTFYDELYNRMCIALKKF